MNSVNIVIARGRRKNASISDRHQIRIQIGKSEIKQSLSKDHKPDMSLLYYDFNGSSTSIRK